MITKLDTSVVGNDFRELSFQLMRREKYLPDIMHNLPALTDAFMRMSNLGGEMFGAYTDKGLVGFFFLSDMIPGHEANFLSWFWGPFPHGTVKFIREYLEAYSKQFSLCRITARTSDDSKHGRILELCGFKQEGRLKWAYKSGGKLHTLFLYRRLFPVGVTNGI